MIGVVDYVGIWDFDEFFIPLGKYNNMIDVIEDLDYTSQSYSDDEKIRLLEESIRNQSSTAASSG